MNIMREEQLKILKMIEEGTITAEEGNKLLSTIEECKGKIDVEKKGSRAKWLRIKVISNEKGGKNKVNVNVPIALVETGLKIGKSFDKDLEESMKDIDIEEILELIKSGAEGKIVEVETEEGDTVEVYVE
jgi:hypothetical protein